MDEKNLAVIKHLKKAAIDKCSERLARARSRGTLAPLPPENGFSLTGRSRRLHGL
ncbi:MAG: hypothetical protein GKC04_01470 [Methanomicrobiales archaeon]|nr:hypothetical protein [Methanomicrobiales archaeon]